MKLFQIKTAIGVAAILMLACNAPKEVRSATIPDSKTVGVDPALVAVAYAPSSIDVSAVELDPLADLAKSSSVAAAAAGTLVASITRTGCYGKCPTYEAKVYASGLVLFEGKEYTGRNGLYEGYLLPKQIDSLVNRAESIQYFDMAQHYPPNGFTLSGLPSTITYLKAASVEHKITNNHNAPKELRKYERYFEEVLEELDWKPVIEH